MKICKECGGIAEWNSYYGGITCTRCWHVEKPKLTNYDSIIKKSPVELACFIQQTEVDATISGDRSYREILDWLNAPAEG